MGKMSDAERINQFLESKDRLIMHLAMEDVSTSYQQTVLDFLDGSLFLSRNIRVLIAQELWKKYAP